ncbi:MAG: hypothetical protein WKG32_07845 [Gemmatimonadaceae bacterium]
MTASRGATPSRLSSRARDAALVSVLIALAAALYRPWHATPFELYDFSEFLGYLLDNDTVGARMRAVLHYYAQQGRIPVLQYIQLVLTWELFGAQPLGWKVVKFVTLAVVVAVTYALMRRLGASRAGATAGAALLVCAPVDVANWLRVHITEPSGFLLILAATWVATSYQTAARWRERAVAIAALITLAMWFKETFVAFVPFIVLVGCCWQRGGQLLPLRLDRRAWFLVLAIAAPVALSLSAFLYASSHGSPEAYAANYAAGGRSAEGWTREVFDRLRALTLPVRGSWLLTDNADRWRSEARALLVPANVIFLLLVAAGVTVAWKRGDGRATAARAGIALSIPIAGLVVYLPWPWFHSTYALVFLLGSAILLAFSLTWLESVGKRGVGLAAYALAALTVAHASIVTQKDATRFMVLSVVEADAAIAMRAYAGSDSILVAAWPEEARVWWGLPARLGRYAVAGQPLSLRVVGVTCDRIGTAARRAPAAPIVLYVDRCAHVMKDLPPPTRWLRSPFAYLHWRLLRPMTDSVRINLWDPRTGEHAAAQAEAPAVLAR